MAKKEFYRIYKFFPSLFFHHFFALNLPFLFESHEFLSTEFGMNLGKLFSVLNKTVTRLDQNSYE